MPDFGGPERHPGIDVALKNRQLDQADQARADRMTAGVTDAFFNYAQLKQRGEESKARVKGQTLANDLAADRLMLSAMKTRALIKTRADAESGAGYGDLVDSAGIGNPANVVDVDFDVLSDFSATMGRSLYYPVPKDLTGTTSLLPPPKEPVNSSGKDLEGIDTLIEKLQNRGK
jgi:hypothetical protein